MRKGISDRLTRASASVAVFDSGFVLHEGSREVGRIRWDDIRRVEAYKRDSVTYDVVCLSVVTDAAGDEWELNDELLGFWDVANAMPAALPGFDARWQESVVKPAFAANRRVLFTR